MFANHICFPLVPLGVPQAIYKFIFQLKLTSLMLKIQSTNIYVQFHQHMLVFLNILKTMVVCNNLPVSILSIYSIILYLAFCAFIFEQDTLFQGVKLHFCTFIMQQLHHLLTHYYFSKNNVMINRSTCHDIMCILSR